jgi:hypothetical protein
MKQVSLDPGCWDLGRLQTRMIGQRLVPDETDRVSAGGHLDDAVRVKRAHAFKAFHFSRHDNHVSSDLSE